MTATHIYIGPSTRYGLAHCAPCRVLGSKAGGLRVGTADGRVWIVGRHQVEPVSTRHRLSVRERVSEFVKAAA